MPEYKNLPHKPGVYIYQDKAGKIIYVGKAIDLRNRVSQYFNSDTALGPKTKTLVKNIAKIDYKIIGSEIEALILESNLIKLHHPKYNSRLMDDKNYIYICISKDTYPRIFSAHSSKLDDKKYTAFGPFPDSASVKFLLKSIRNIFPYRTFKAIHPKNCLYCHLGLCPGPTPPKDYQKTIAKIKNILTGKSKKLIDSLQIDMFNYSNKYQYEKALITKKQIESLFYINSSWKNINRLTNSINLPQDKYISALSGLKTLLSKYTKVDQINRIEAYDISNMGNKCFVGAMSVFEAGHIDNSQYRKFKIKTKHSQDDQYMIQEIVSRRLKHTNWLTPQIILVDGGKPQVTAVSHTISKNIILIGLAKQEEIIIIKTNTGFDQIKLPIHSHSLRLLQHLRDEAHRFANKYRLQLSKL